MGGAAAERQHDRNIVFPGPVHVLLQTGLLDFVRWIRRQIEPGADPNSLDAQLLHQRVNAFVHVVRPLGIERVRRELHPAALRSDHPGKRGGKDASTPWDIEHQCISAVLRWHLGRYADVLRSSLRHVQFHRGRSDVADLEYMRNPDIALRHRRTVVDQPERCFSANVLIRPIRQVEYKMRLFTVSKDVHHG